jgi:hypothetical protein
MIQIPNPNEDMIFIRCICLVAISLAGCAACWWAAGTSLGLFLGGLFIATFLVPAAVLKQKNLPAALRAFIAAIAPIAITWLLATLKTQDTIGQWFQVTAILFAYALAISGIAALLAALKFPEIFAAAIAIILALAWLTWPIWLSAAHPSNATIATLVRFHPPLTINGILTNEPAWTEMSLAYHLTNLNQDVPIQLPSNAAPCALAHAIVGILFWTAGYGIARKPRRLYPMDNPILSEKS